MNDDMPNPYDMSIDLKEKLKETMAAIGYITSFSGEVPREGYEIAAILRRAIWAEEKVAQLEKNKEEKENDTNISTR